MFLSNSRYQEIEQQNFPYVSQLSFEQKCFYLTLRCVIRHESYRIAWCEEASTLLSEE